MKPKKRNERANDVKALYKRIKTMPPKKRAETVNTKEGQYWLALLTPTQFAELFPTYYKKALPDVGLTRASSGAIIKGGQTPTFGGGAGTATPIPPGRGGMRGEGWKDYPRSATPVPPDPLKVLKGNIEKATGIKIEPPSESKNLADMRKAHTEEINSNQEVKTKLYALMKAEVGGQGEEAQQAFLETVFNRASQRGVSIDTIISDGAYYEPYQNGAFERAKTNLNKDDVAKFDRSISKVAAGSNLTEGAMHNASAGVAASARQGGYNSIPSTVKEVGGETFYGKTWEKEHREQINKAYKEGIEESDNERRNIAQSGSTDINAHPLTPITKPIGMNEELTKLWDTFKTPQEQARFVEALQKLAKEGKAGVDVANEMAKAAPKQDGVPQGIVDGSLIHEDQKTKAAIRRGDIKPELKEQLQYAAEKTGVQVEVVSGGQRMEGAYGWTGSHRHDQGGAADLKLFRVDENGRRQYLSMNNAEDRAIMKQFAKESVKAGATGIGAGHGYMGAETMHIGGGSETYWGGAEWIGEAHREGIGERQTGEFEVWKQQKIEEAKAKREADDAAKAKAINEDQRAKAETGSTSINQHPLTPNMKTLKEPLEIQTPSVSSSDDTPRPFHQRGMTSGHPNEGQNAPTAAPTVTPAPAPTPPPAAPTPSQSSGSDRPGEPGPLRGSQEGQGIRPDGTQTPAPKPQSSLTAPNNMAENKTSIPTDHPAPSPSFDRAMKNTGVGRPGENSTATYKT